MDAFYRQVRRRTGLLIDKSGAPAGGRFSFDGENRRSWQGTPKAPAPLHFAVDEVTQEVGEFIATRFAAHPGTLDLAAIPATHADALALWRYALETCLPDSGPYEDAMSTRSSGLFHARIGALLNLHRLLPRDIVADVVAADLPLASKEGFVRQVLGWREFVRHVHRATDGFRTNASEVAARPSVSGGSADREREQKSSFARGAARPSLEKAPCSSYPPAEGVRLGQEPSTTSALTAVLRPMA